MTDEKRECCDACGRRSTSAVHTTVVDDGGGALAVFCPSCADRLDENGELLAEGVCVACVRPRSPSRSEGLHFQTSEPARHLCDECRRAVVFDDDATLGRIPRVHGGGDGR
jgi:hypothetical protein